MCCEKCCILRHCEFARSSDGRIMAQTAKATMTSHGKTRDVRFKLLRTDNDGGGGVPVSGLHIRQMCQNHVLADIDIDLNEAGQVAYWQNAMNRTPERKVRSSTKLGDLCVNVSPADDPVTVSNGHALRHMCDGSVLTGDAMQLDHSGKIVAFDARVIASCASVAHL